MMWNAAAALLEMPALTTYYADKTKKKNQFVYADFF